MQIKLDLMQQPLSYCRFGFPAVTSIPTKKTRGRLATRFVSNLCCAWGETVAGSAERFLKHVPKDRSQVVGLARELVEASRNAA